MGICESDKAATHAFAENLMYEKKNGDVFKHYEEVKLLGEGSMGSVSLVRKKVSGGESFDTIHEHKGAAVMLARRPTSPGKGSPYKEYALKSIVVTRVTDEFMDELKNEIDLLKSLDHPNIVKVCLGNCSTSLKFHVPPLDSLLTL
jgi:serine/threonine protein kinase